MAFNYIRKFKHKERGEATSIDGLNMIPISDDESILLELSRSAPGETIRFRTKGCPVSLEYQRTLNLEGIPCNSFSKIGDGSIITLFDKTPFPKEKDDVVCPHFIELKWANGCNFDCAWCYLNGTFRFRPCGKKPYLKEKDKIINHIKQYLEQVSTSSILNSGELSDSLAFEGSENSLSDMIIPLFKDQNSHKLLILTKSANMKGILKSESQDSVIVSYSINSQKVSSRWENKAPSPLERLYAAKEVFEAGYNVRLRLDPMVPISGWKNSYRSIIDQIFNHLIPERITLGSLRGLQSTINNSKDRTWVDYLDDRSNWGKKISFAKRAEMYDYVISYLERRYDFSDIGLCKETIGMWEEMGKDYKKIKCNCII